MSLFSRLFARKPAYHESAYGPVYAAVVARLERPGVRVGRGAGYPRIEVHTITEGERLDKEGMLRQLSFTVESIGNASLSWSCLGRAHVHLERGERRAPDVGARPSGRMALPGSASGPASGPHGIRRLGQDHLPPAPGLHGLRRARKNATKQRIKHTTMSAILGNKNKFYLKSSSSYTWLTGEQRNSVNRTH